MRKRPVIVAALCLLIGTGALRAVNAVAESDSRAQQLFQLCAQCHGADAQGVQVNLAPAIAGQYSWYIARQLRHFRAGIRGTHFDDIGGMRMRPMALTLQSDADVQTIANYVASLPPGKPAPTLSDGDPVKGKAFFATCMACHGPNAAGNQQLNAPALNHASDWYLLTQLQNFRAGVRGAKPNDTTGIIMRPMAMTLPDKQALRDVIAYIMTLTPQAP